MEPSTLKTTQFSFFEGNKTDPEVLSKEVNKNRIRSASLITREKNTVYRRAFSETQLLDIIASDFSDGTENGCITITKEIYEFYKSYFDGIISFEK